MSFEETLRDRLEHDAHAIPLPEREPGRAAARARARHRHRVVVAGVAAVTAVVAAAVPLLARGDHPASRQKTVVPVTSGRLPTGPLALAWRDTQGGLRTPIGFNVDADGSIYVLGSAAATDTRPVVGNIYAAPTLYKLTAGGTWQATALGGDKPAAKTVVSAKGKLYAVSTSPATAGGTQLPRVSMSADGGRTWTGQDLPVAPPPAGSTHLLRDASARIAGNGKDVLAVVSTSFEVDGPAVFPELKTQPGLVAEARPDGVVLLRNTGRGGFTLANGQPFPSSTSVYTSRAGQTSPFAKFKVVRRVPWSDLGVSGIEALGPVNQVFLRHGHSWRPVDTDPKLTDQVVELQVAGDRFLVYSFRPGGTGDLFFASDDGVHWQQLTAPKGRYIVGAGPALVSVPLGGSTVRVSQDGGASWKDVDLRVRPGESVVGASGGELGVALILSDGPYKSFDLAVSADLASWTVTPLASVVGPGPVYEAFTVVGNDKVVVSAVKGDGPRPGGPAVTAVGTPVRR